MDYTTGQIGRVFVIRFDDGDDVLGGLQSIVKAERIMAGCFTMLGGLRNADVVTGPVEPTMPPVPVWEKIEGAREVVGIGSVYWDNDNEPRIHLHTALGHHGQTTTACVRKGTKAYLVLEVILTEVTGIHATRPWFEQGQFYRLAFGPAGAER